MTDTDTGEKRRQAQETIQQLVTAGEDDEAALAREFNEAVDVLRATGGYASDVTRIARVARTAPQPVLRREAVNNLGAIAVERGAYADAAITALAVALRGGAAARHPDNRPPDADARVRLQAAVWLGQAGTAAREGVEAFDCYEALLFAAGHDENEDVRVTAVAGLSVIGRAKLFGWAAGIVDELLKVAQNEKSPAVLREIKMTVTDLMIRRQNLIQEMNGGGSSPLTP